MAIDCRTFIEALIAEGIFLFEKSGRLGCKTAKGVSLTAEQKQQIQAVKPQLIAFLAESNAQPSQPSLRTPPPITAYANKDAQTAPLSFAQQQLWAVQSMYETSTEYHMNFVFDIQGNFNIEAAAKSFLCVLHRHEILRSVYTQENGEVVQKVLSLPAEFELPLYRVSAEYWESEVGARLAAEKTRVFDLSADLMLRACVLQKIDCDKQTDVTSKLVLTLHHIAADGWSLDILFREFIQYYGQYVAQKTIGVKPLAVQYRDFAKWQREWFDGEVLKEALAYWDKQLTAVPECHRLPTKGPRPETKQSQAAHVSASLGKNVAEGLQRHCRELALTPFMLLHGALALTIAAYSEQNDIVIGIPSANRTDTALNDLIGYFVNTLVLRANTQHDDLNQYFQHVKQQHLDAQVHQMLPFEKIVEQANVKRSAAYNPLFQIMLITNTDYGLAENRGALSIPGASIQPSAQGVDEQVKFDIDIRIDLTTTGVRLAWSYDVALFSAVQIEAMNGHLQHILTQLACVTTLLGVTTQSIEPNSRPLLARLERTQPLDTLIETKNCVTAPSNDISQTPNLLNVLKELAQSQGDDIALKTNDVALTFSELALQVAAYISNAQEATIFTRADDELLAQQVQIIAAICSDVGWRDGHNAVNDSAETKVTDAKAIECNKVSITNVLDTISRLEYYWPNRQGQWATIAANSLFTIANVLRGWTVHLYTEHPPESLESIDVIHGSVMALSCTARQTSVKLPAVCCVYEPLQAEVDVSILVNNLAQNTLSLMYAENDAGAWYATRLLPSAEFNLEASWNGWLISQVDGRIRPRLSQGLLVLQRQALTHSSADDEPELATQQLVQQINETTFLMLSREPQHQQLKIHDALYSVAEVLCCAFSHDGVVENQTPTIMVDLQSDLTLVRSKIRHALNQYGVSAFVETLNVLLASNPLNVVQQLKASNAEIKWTFSEQKSSQQLSIESELITLWNSLLPNTSELTPQINLFEAGATSMLMIMAMSKINAIFAVNITPDFIVKHSSIAAQARFLAAQQISNEQTETAEYAIQSNNGDIVTPSLFSEADAHFENTSFVPLVEDSQFNRRPTVYWIHPYGGSALSYRSLANQLPLNSFGLQAPFYAGVDFEFTDLDALVNNYANQIASHSTQRNIVLAGFSLGGVIAALLVPALQKKDLVVSNLWVLDSYVDSFTILQRETLAERLLDVVEFVNADSRLVSQAVSSANRDNQTTIASLASLLAQQTQADAAFIRHYLTFHSQIGQLTDSNLVQQLTQLNVPICSIANSAMPNSEQNQQAWQRLSAAPFASQLIKVSHNDFLKQANLQPLAEFIRQRCYSLFEEA